MVLLTEDNFPVTFGFLRKLGLELYDDNGRRMLPDFVDLFEGHFEKSVEMHDYVVSYSSEFVFASISFLQIIPIFLELISFLLFLFKHHFEFGNTVKSICISKLIIVFPS